MSRAATLFEFLDNRLNPILVKELRQSVKNRVVLGILSFFLLFQLLMLVIGVTAGTSDQAIWSNGAQVFMYQQVILIFTILTALPAYAGARMLSERTDAGSDLMFLTTLSPSSIIWGKLLGCLTLGLLVFSVCAPFMTLAYLLRGIDLLSIFFVLAFDLLLMLLTMQFALFSALLPGGLLIKRMAAGCGFIGLLIFSFSLMNAFAFSINTGFSNWIETLVFTIPILGFFGYFLVYSIAMVSAPSANSMFIVRIYITLAVLSVGLLLIGVASWSPASWSPAASWGYIPYEYLPTVFAICLMPFLCAQILVSVCERDHWGPRITRTVPRMGLLRGLAFLFYSGSAGGVLHAALMIALAMGMASYLGLKAASITGVEPRSLFPMVILALYTYSYCMTGLLLRSMLPSTHLRPENTWILVAILLGVMSAMPNVIAYSIHGDRMDQESFAWWNLTNPFYHFFDWSWLSGNRGGNDDVLLKFLVLWTAGVTLLALPQFVGQFLRFRRQETQPVYERAQVINELPA